MVRNNGGYGILVNMTIVGSCENGPPAEIVSHVKFDQWSGDMTVGSCGLVAIHA